MEIQRNNNNNQQQDFESGKDVNPNLQMSVNVYLDENMSAFDESFSITGLNGGEMLNSLPPVKKLEEFSMNGLPVMKESEDSNMKILTGNITQVLKWSRIGVPSLLTYKTIGMYVSDWDNGLSFQRVLLLRQPRGPVMKVVTFHTKYPEVPHCVPGQYLKVIGRISEENIMIAHKVSTATEIDFQRLERAAQICDRAVKHY